MSCSSWPGETLKPAEVNSERRRQPRFGCKAYAWCEMPQDPGNPTFDCQVLNVSEGGAGLVIAEQPGVLERGAQVFLCLINAAGMRLGRLMRIVHAGPHPGGGLQIGGAFLRAFTPADLKHLLVVSD